MASGTGTGKAVGLLSPMLVSRVADLDALLRQEGGARALSFLRRPPAGIRMIAQFQEEAPAMRARVADYAERWKLPLLPLRRGPVGAVVPRRAGDELPLLCLLVGPESPAAMHRALEHAAAAPEAVATATRLIDAMRRDVIGCANHAALPESRDYPKAGRPLVLVIDEAGPEAAMHAMLEAAIAENPGAELRLLSLAGLSGEARQGTLLNRALALELPVEAPGPPSAWSVTRAVRVYVHASPIGLDALIQGAPVTCFGRPPYAGWGLTDDRAAPREAASPDLPLLLAALTGDFCRCIDPATGAPTTIDVLVRHAAAMIEQDRRLPGETVVVGLKPWKRANLRPFLESRVGRVSFAPDVATARRRLKGTRGRVAVWAATSPPEIAAEAEAAGLEVLRVEDGFLRSVGLGSNHVAPASLVLDTRGIYYDPTGPSDLETLLAETRFTDEEREEARRLARLIVERGLSKYNVGRPGDGAVQAPAGRARLLVPGQVEDDASVRRGAEGMGGNRGLLEAVRSTWPDAWIVYKPHPDVEAGNRQGRIPRADALRLADQVIDDVSVVSLFEQVDAVHTMTSLVGFEALLRGLPVTTWGLPFYAGWGLTEDRQPCPRRTRRLTLEDLVVGTLIRYPRYVDPLSGQPCDVWTVVERLAAGPQGAARLRGGQLARARAWARALGRSVRPG
ncbi:MAG: hypothetical protein PHS60_17520 [Zavarzinia sp.]|nr:hypothetical protein [Zavarzinia sp.]